MTQAAFRSPPSSASPVLYRDGSYHLDLREVVGWLPVLVLAYPLIGWPMAFSAFTLGTGTGTDLSNVEASNSNAINVLYFLAVGGLAGLLALPRLYWGARVVWTGALVAVVLYLGWSALSTLWALNTSISMRRLILQGLVVLAGLFAALVDRDPRRLAHRLFWLALLTVGLNILWLGVKPPTPLGVEGIYPQKNVLGGVLLIVLPILVFAAVTRRGLLRLVAFGAIGGAFLLLVLSQSKTSLGLTIVVPLVVLGAMLAARVLRTNPALLIGFAILLLYVGWVLLTQVTGITADDLSLVLFGDPTFTGRTYIWDFIGEQIDERPVFGYGYNSFWAVGYDSPSFREAPGFIISLIQSHNGYLDVRIETGLIGFTILCAMIAFALAQTASLAKRDPALGFLAMTLVLTAILHNLLESSFVRNYAAMWVGFLLAIALSTPRFGTTGSEAAVPQDDDGVRTALPDAP